MQVTIKPWDQLVAEFGLDTDGDINSPKFFSKFANSRLPPSRVISITEDIWQYSSEYSVLIDPNIIVAANTLVKSPAYILLARNNHTELANAITFQLQKGYSLHGTIVADNNMLLQAMTYPQEI